MRPKKKWADKGVSPVIATILMVAITVALAAMLYAMVMIPPPPKPPSAIGFNTPEKIAANEWKIAVISVTPDGIAITNFKVMLFNGTSKVIDPIVIDRQIPAYDEGGYRALTIKFNDLTSDGKLGKGDYFTFTFAPGAPPSGNTYELKVLSANDDGEMANIEVTT